jgi:hypothetical protein
MGKGNKLWGGGGKVKADDTRKIIFHGAKSALALPLRVGIFTDEDGISISNPLSNVIQSI